MKKELKFKKLTRDHKGRFAIKRGVLKLIFSLIIALLLALLLVRLFGWIEERFMWDGKFVSPEARVAENDYKVKFTEGRVDVSDTKIINMIVSEFEEFGATTVRNAINIAYCESRFNERAEHFNKNGSVDRGIYQINSVYKYSPDKLFAAYENIRIAKQMYVRNHYSFSAWVCK